MLRNLVSQDKNPLKTLLSLHFQALISVLGCGLAGAGSIFYNGYQPYHNYGYVPSSLGYNANYGYNGLAYRMPHYPSPAPVVPYSRASQVQIKNEPSTNVSKRSTISSMLKMSLAISSTATTI